jgi:hypothetical protein
MTFKTLEYKRQSDFKHTSNTISESARVDGQYRRGGQYPFCLPQSYAVENLFPGIREEALDLFEKLGIPWHGGATRQPNNHMCSSQVCCVNFLLPLAHSPESLKALFSAIYPQIDHMEEVEDGYFVSFEWIGEQNYLHEKVRKGFQRTRGANCTSADAIIRFVTTTGKRHMVLIEWKYTESYSPRSCLVSQNGTDRSQIYQPLFERSDFPLDKSLLPAYSDLFYEPFYQFLRQQLLANEMEKAHENGADIVSVLHICPEHNHEFSRVTSPGLENVAKTATEVWKKLLINKDRFKSISTESLFGNMNSRNFEDLTEWKIYLSDRYGWINTPK